MGVHGPTYPPASIYIYMYVEHSFFDKVRNPPTGKKFSGAPAGARHAPPASPRRQWVPREPPMPPITMGVAHRPSHRSPAPKGGLEKKGAPNHVIFGYVGGPVVLLLGIYFVRGHVIRARDEKHPKSKFTNWQTRNAPTGKTEIRQLAKSNSPTGKLEIRQLAKSNSPTGKTEIRQLANPAATLD